MDSVRAAFWLSLLLVGCAEGVAGARPPRGRSTPRTEASGPSQETPPAPTPAPAVDPVTALLALTGSTSTSIGMPQNGRLEGGAQLPESGPGFRSNPRRPNSTATFGTVEMVQSLVRAAGLVDQELPGSVLFINDIGLPNGGPIAHHGSHRAGRDVDVLFYLLDRRRQPLEPVGAFLDTHGRGYDFKDLSTARDDVLVRLDGRRTWRFMQALLEGPNGSDVQRIFLAEHLRTLLLTYAVRARAPRAIRDRFGELTCQPSAPHDDHMHIRFFCTPEDLAGGCQDVTPVYTWRRNELRELGVEPVLGRRGRRPPSPRGANLNMQAGVRRHPRVIEWLTKREAWLTMPHPGRPYCR